MAPLVGLTTWSFTVPRERVFDRVQRIASRYVDAIVAAGGVPLLLPSCAGPDAALAALRRLDGVVLTGGGDVDPVHFGAEPHPRLDFVDPDRDDLELALARRCVEGDVPLLGICRGVQVLNVALGGTVVQHLDPGEVPGMVQHDVRAMREGPGHTIAVEGGTLLARILGAQSARVTSAHHQAVGRPADGLVVSARAPDGVIEAIEHPNRQFVLGVQWHPERTIGRDTFSDGIFAAFTAACGGSDIGE